MGKKKTIEAKSTDYRKRTFRSRLEARWAVYFDNCPLVDQWAYEPRTFRDPETGWTYTPDFQIQVGRGEICGWMEVKPILPTQDAVENLHRFIGPLGRCQGFHLALAFGSFYQEEEPRVFMIGPGPCPSVRTINTKATPISEVPILGDPLATKKASAYRFDLPEKVPHYRQPGGRTPWDYWKN